MVRRLLELCCLVALLSVECRSHETRKPHILLILMDTLRADHLGCYGYSRNTSPNIDAMAQNGIFFKYAYTVSPWTNPTIASIFTGQFPQAIFPTAVHEEAITQVLPKELNTTAELLKANGYKTIALIDHPGIGPELQYDQGFDVFVKLFEKGNFGQWSRTDVDYVLKEFNEQMDAARGKRVFLYLHLVYPHMPYRPPPPYDTMFGTGFTKLSQEERQGIINMYDGEIRQTDDAIGRINEELQKRKLTDETYVLVTSDHGEAFWEHGRFTHGNSYFDEVLRIALVITGPRNAVKPAQISEPVSNIDIFPTILHLASVEPPQGTPGKSLLRYATDSSRAPEPGFIFSENASSKDIHSTACLCQNRKYVHEPGVPNNPHLLYDLSRDPEEKRNLAAEGVLYSDLQKRMLEHLQENKNRRSRLSVKSVEPDDETKERLRALGYVDEN